jgi:hypothetical protein
MRLFICLVVFLPSTHLAADEVHIERGFWKALVQPKANWLLEEAQPAKGREAAKVRIETYDCRTIEGASVARLRWTHGLGPKSQDIGDSDRGRYTQIAVTKAGIYLLSADMDDAVVAKSLKRRPSRSDPPRSYVGSSENQERYLIIESGPNGPVACMGSRTLRESDTDPVVGEVCVSAAKGFVFLGGGYAPAGKTFAQAGYKTRVLPPQPYLEPSALPMNTLLVAGEHGIQEVDLEGRVLRTLSKTPAGAARYLPKQEGVLFDGPNHDLYLLMLSDGSERLVAKMPKKFKACASLPDYSSGHRFTRSEVDIHSADDFVVDKSGESACLRLADRNDNMMNFNVELFVTLKTGNVKAYPWCNSEKETDSSLSSPGCTGTEWFESQTPPDNRARFPFALAKGRLVKRDTDGRTTRVATLGSGDFSGHQI